MIELSNFCAIAVDSRKSGQPSRRIINQKIDKVKRIEESGCPFVFTLGPRAIAEANFEARDDAVS